jgi:hypothetical protein
MRKTRKGRGSERGSDEGRNKTKGRNKIYREEREKNVQILKRKKVDSPNFYEQLLTWTQFGKRNFVKAVAISHKLLLLLLLLWYVSPFHALTAFAMPSHLHPAGIASGFLTFSLFFPGWGC